MAQPDVASLAALGFEPDVQSWSISRLSSGERQRLALLRLLANQPMVLLLDEPTANLDGANAERVESLIRRFQDATGAAVLWVSHDAAQGRRVADRALEIRDGALQELPAWS